ncbi:hypothetical protein BDY19DRAFT_995422 [Irpex rosettiformis]|uniref:Uncharacterized protein n=1 Tax=Irpex rosettiformis TaxID=378272 RepID=A0ACB8TY61_9APHY|nr:hypothetical protein BDY19DRAFT_995422 [Irpex rosettiformis]
MPTSAETAARSDVAPNDDIIDRRSYTAQNGPIMPSEVVPPTEVEDVSQQGATQPGSGSTVTTHPPRFKEKVIGYAKEIRGTALGKHETKEQGQRIVHGEEKFEPKKVGSTDTGIRGRETVVFKTRQKTSKASKLRDDMPPVVVRRRRRATRRGASERANFLIGQALNHYFNSFESFLAHKPTGSNIIW